MSLPVKNIKKSPSNDFSATFNSEKNLWLNNNVYGTRSVFVDDKYGNDSTAVLNKKNRPFKTIDAAWNAINTTGTWNIYINNGTYNLTETLLSQTNINYNIFCTSRKGVIINGPSPIGHFINNNGTAGGDRLIKIYSGTWNHLGAATAFQGFNKNRFWFYGCDLNNITGGSVLYNNLVMVVEDCVVISNVNSMFAGANAGKTLSSYRNSYFECVSGNIVPDNSFFRNDINFENCKIVSQTGRFHSFTANSNIKFNNSHIKTFLSCFSIRGVADNYIGTCILETTSNQSPLVINGITGTYYKLVSFDTIIFKQLTTSNSSCISAGAGQTKRDMNITQNLYCKNPPTNTIFGAIGCIFNGTGATEGNIITANLPSPFNTSAITYTIQSGETKESVINELYSLINSELTVQGTPWNLWTGGDANNIITGSTVIRVSSYSGTPQGSQMATTTSYFSETGDDIVNSNILQSGINNHGSGNINIIDNEIAVFGTDKRWSDYMEFPLPHRYLDT
jgi:hypothetical protein